MSQSQISSQKHNTKPSAYLIKNGILDFFHCKLPKQFIVMLNENIYSVSALSVKSMLPLTTLAESKSIKPTRKLCTTSMSFFHHCVWCPHW